MGCCDRAKEKGSVSQFQVVNPDGIIIRGQLHLVMNQIQGSIIQGRDQQLVSNLASYPGVRGEGRRKRTPGAHCLRMRLIKSPFYNDDVFVWVGFCS